MIKLVQSSFQLDAFLGQSGPGRTMVRLRRGQLFFSQGTPADCIFYLHSGRARVSVSSRNGREATIMLLTAGDFVGEELVDGDLELHAATAAAITRCNALRIERKEMIRLLHEEHAFASFFMKFLLNRNKRIQADLVDQLFNSTEKRLARALLLMANYKPGETKALIPKISQETLAELVGTTRSRVSFFMNRFRARGFVEYRGRIWVDKSLVNVILHE